MLRGRGEAARAPHSRGWPLQCALPGTGPGRAGPQIKRPLITGQLDVCVSCTSRGLDLGPESAGADRLVLVRVADLDQPRTALLHGAEHVQLFACGGERGLVVDHGGLVGQFDPADGDRGGSPAVENASHSTPPAVSSLASRSAASPAVLVTRICRPSAWWARAMPVSAVLFPVPACPSITTSRSDRRRADRRALLVGQPASTPA